MSHQLTFADSEFSSKRRQTRKEIFLSRMEQILPWQNMTAVIEPFYPKAGNGRRPYPLETMLRIHCMQHWYNLSDGAMEDALYEIASMRLFARLSLDSALPDRTTIMNFRHLLEQHQLARQLFKTINRWLAEAGVMMTQGTLVDATIIEAPSSTKNKEQQRDPEMHQTKKGNQWHFGMKAHIGVDAKSGLTHSLVTTAANEHDLNQLGNLLHGEEQFVSADAGYQGAPQREELAEVDVLCDQLSAGAFEAVAVCLLFAYASTQHERLIKQRLSERLNGVPLSTSHQIAPIWREYERSSTTIADAFLKPLLQRYVASLQRGLHDNRIDIHWALMKSNGGIMQEAAAAAHPIQLALSGPAGGMVASQYLARLLKLPDVVTIDVGGTSADVGIIVANELHHTTEYEIEWGLPAAIPIIDLKTIGAGGGSIAWLDAGGLLHVGPESAGANPGPICYNRGGARPTTTDANVVLGRVAPGHFVSGYDEAAYQRAVAALTGLGAKLRLSMLETALAIVEIANANMSDAIKLLTLARGLDPRHFALMAFGGAGPLHAAAMARGLGMPKVLVPPYPGMCSALGMLVADLRIDKVTTFPATSDRVTLAELDQRFHALIAAASTELAYEGFAGAPQINATVSMRYLGQNYEEDVPVNLDALRQQGLTTLFTDFHHHHEQRYGYQIAGEIIEIVALKVTALGAMPKPQIRGTGADHRAATGQPFETRQVYFKETGWVACPIYWRNDLPVGAELTGPAIVEELGCTTLLEPGQQLRVDEVGMLAIAVRGNDQNEYQVHPVL